VTLLAWACHNPPQENDYAC